MPDGKNDWIVTSLSGLIFFMSSMPLEVKTLQFLVFVMIVSDTITGIVRAAVSGKLSSRRMRLDLLSKLGCYFGFVILAGIAAVISHTWFPFSVAYATIMAIEGTSILENIVVFAKNAHLNLGPANNLLNILSGIFGINKEDKAIDHVLTSTTVLSGHADGTTIQTIDVTTMKNPNENK